MFFRPHCEEGSHLRFAVPWLTIMMKTVHETFENSNPTVADVCACLWFAKVVARDLDTSAATDNGERKQKITAVVTTGVV